MSQINVNTSQPTEPRDSGESAVAVGINLVTVLIILAVAIIIIAAAIWFFTSSGYFTHGGAAPTPATGGPKSVPTVPQKTSEVVGAVLALF